MSCLKNSFRGLLGAGLSLFCLWSVSGLSLVCVWSISGLVERNNVGLPSCCTSHDYPDSLLKPQLMNEFTNQNFHKGVRVGNRVINLIFTHDFEFAKFPGFTKSKL